MDVRIFDTKQELGRAAAERAAAAIGEAIARSRRGARDRRHRRLAVRVPRGAHGDAGRRVGDGSTCSTSTSTSG